MVTSTWQDRELPILRYVVQAWEDGGSAEVQDIAEVLDLDYDQVVRVVDILYEDGYLIGLTVGQKPYLLRIEPTAKARPAVRQWPVEGEELYDRLLQALDELIANERDERQRTRLQRARDALRTSAATSSRARSLRR